MFSCRCVVSLRATSDLGVAEDRALKHQIEWEKVAFVPVDRDDVSSVPSAHLCGPDGKSE
jgi:hypothetical protein